MLVPDGIIGMHYMYKLQMQRVVLHNLKNLDTYVNTGNDYNYSVRKITQRVWFTSLSSGSSQQNDPVGD